jgi:uncharacterized protein (DUF2235 family)
MGKRIVVLADGTGNTVSRDDSNVLRLCRALDLSRPQHQIAVYDPGVGTRTTTDELRRALPPIVQFIEDDRDRESTFARRARWLLGLGFGLGTDRNLRQLYEWLARAYEPGDEIYLFAFSRGAFTVRALAGLIYRCGLLRREKVALVSEALRLYKQHYERVRSAADLRSLKLEVASFRRDNSHPTNVRFLGIWDTVKSVGYLRPKNLPHTRHNPIVQTVRHAVSLDERRSMYAMTTWGGLDGDTRPAVFVPAWWGNDHSGRPPVEWQDIQEVWFAGNHADVGGGYPSDQRWPADVSLQWMVNEARNCDLLVLEPVEQPDRGIDGLTRSLLHDELNRRGTRRDTLWRRWWRFLEWVPRMELNNEPPPPRRMFRWGPAGPRRLREACRDGVVTIHRSAVGCYEKADAPWSGLEARFADTGPSGAVTAPSDPIHRTS